MKRKKSDYIIIIIAIALFAALLYKSCEDGREYRNGERYLKEEIEHLQNQNDSLLQDNDKKDEKIEQFKHETDSLLAEADKKEVKIEKIYIARNEKIRTIDSMDGNELYGFFAEFNTTGTGN